MDSIEKSPRIRERMRQEIRLRNLSPHTEETYLRYSQQLADFHQGRSPLQLGAGDVRRFFVDMVDRRKSSASTLHVALASVRFLYRDVLRRPWVVTGLPNPKVPLKLPVVLSPKETIALLDCTPGIRQRTLANVIYATGLRDHEARHLRPAHIDTSRGLVIVANGKGRRDREVPLGTVLPEVLRDYWRAYHPQPPYLFPGKIASQPLTRNALARALRNGARAARINKRVSAHVLRHSFATHSLERGVNLRVIQEILGHRDILTTLRYTHVRAEHVSSLTTPLDALRAAKADEPNKNPPRK